MSPDSTSSPVASAEAAFRARLRSAPWRFLTDGAATGERNMARDVELLHDAALERCGPTLRLYAWDPPAVSLGRFQDEDGIDVAYARARGWHVVRRPTGGRAVLHQHEVTYSLVLPPSLVNGGGVRTTYRVLTGALRSGLDSLIGAATAPECERPTPDPSAPRQRPSNCFALPCECDTVVAGRKLVGSAQVRLDGALLQHGSILLDVEPDAWRALFGTTGRLMTLRQLLGRSPDPAQVQAAVFAGFASLTGEG